MSVIEKLKQDVENLVYNYLTGNYEDSKQEEIEDIENMMSLLKECFPEECARAQKNINKQYQLSY